MRVAAWVLLCVAVSALIGCRWHDSGPHLLSVQNIAPKYVDLGDRIELAGSGFPEGKPATVTFRGELLRPGQRPIADVRIVARGFASSHDQVVVSVDRALQAEFCGSGDAPEHTTFRGDVSVAFAPRLAGSAPVMGVLYGVTLDVDAPSPARHVALARERDAARALLFLGIEVEPDANSARLRLAALTPGGRAERAGLLVGDALLAVDGVSVLTRTDLIPARGTRFSTLQVTRGPRLLPVERRVEVTGFHTVAPAELGPAAVGLAAVVLLLLLRSTSLARGLSFTVRAIAQRAHASRAASRSSLSASFRTALGQGAGGSVESGLMRSAPHLSFLTVSATFTVFSFGEYLVSPDMDLGLTCIAAMTPLVALALVLGALDSGRRWSVSKGLRRALRALGHQLPIVCAVAGVVVVTGSVRLSDIVSGQGAWPWQWNAFVSPMATGSLVLWLACLVPQLNPHDELSSRRKLTTPLAVLRAVTEWGHLMAMCAAAATLFLGGWEIPLLDSGERPTLTQAVLGAMLLQLKTWALVGTVLLGRWLYPSLSFERTSRLCWRWLLPLSFALLGLSVVWVACGGNPLVSELSDAVSLVLFLTVSAVILAATLRIRSTLRGTSSVLPVSPWL